MIRSLAFLTLSGFVLGCSPSPAPTGPVVATATAKDDAKPDVPTKPTQPKDGPSRAPNEKAIEEYITKAGGVYIRDVSHQNVGAPILTVKFTNIDVAKVEMKPLEPLPKLMRLDLEGAKNADAILKQLGTLPKLTSLVLADSDVTDEGLDALAKSGVKDLDLSRVKRITAKGWKALAASAVLEELHLDGAVIDDAGFRELAGLKSLKKLVMKDVRLTLAGSGATFAAWKQLKELELKDTAVNDEGLLALCAARGLESLNLNSTAITDAGFKPMASLLKLKTLDLGNTPVTGTGFTHLVDLNKLETVILADAAITDAGLKEIAENRGIKVLDLDRAKKITDDGLKSLATPRSLIDLSLQETMVTNAGVVAVAKQAKSLEKVHVRKSKATKSLAEELSAAGSKAFANFD